MPFRAILLPKKLEAVFMLKRIVACLYLFTLTSGIFAQAPQVIRGKLISKKSGEPVSFASIYIQETGSWTSSDENGLFNFKRLEIPFIIIKVQHLGFETYSGKFDPALFTGSELVIKLVPVSYDMDEITVLSKNDNGLTSSSIVSNAAIEHVQPTSLADVMQLIPGNLSCAFEFRSKSWFKGEIMDLLRKRGCSLCTADTDEKPADEIISTAPWGYLRLRRSNYTETDLSQWVDRILAQKWERAFVFFKHEEEAKGPELAHRFSELIDIKARKSEQEG